MPLQQEQIASRDELYSLEEKKTNEIIFSVITRDENHKDKAVDYIEVSYEDMTDFLSNPSLTPIWFSIRNQYGTPIKSFGSLEQFLNQHPEFR